jgi:hypothetical protein
MNKDEALKLLEFSGIFYDEDEEEPEMRHMINLNDVFGWACADCEKVNDNDLIIVAKLFKQYGWCGILYWVSRKRGGIRSEFLDNNRFIDFVDNEEKLVAKEPDTDKRAYLKYSYTLGK